MSPPVVEVSQGDRALRLSMDLPGVEPSRVVRGFTERELLRCWWGDELAFEPRVGGAYVVSFTAIGQTMRGTVLAYEPSGLLSFTWGWDHESDAPDRSVTVRAVATASGSRIGVEHGPYGDSEAERAEAAGHREGWEHFLPRLAGCLP